MNWLDIDDIVFALDEKLPDTDPRTISFPDLYKAVLALEGFSGDPNRAGERVLEAIQAHWIEERE